MCMSAWAYILVKAFGVSCLSATETSAWDDELMTWKVLSWKVCPEKFWRFRSLNSVVWSLYLHIMIEQNQPSLEQKVPLEREKTGSCYITLTIWNYAFQSTWHCVIPTKATWTNDTLTGFQSQGISCTHRILNCYDKCTCVDSSS